MYDFDLLERLQNRDSDAFLELTDRYGWSIYSAIKQNYPDPAAADRIYNDTMNAFYHSLADSSEDDPVEALLQGFATLISREKLNFNSSSLQDRSAPPPIMIREEPVFAETVQAIPPKKTGIFHVLGNLLLVVAIAAVLWYIAALLMELKVIPYCDLGYSWLDANILQLFR